MHCPSDIGYNSLPVSGAPSTSMGGRDFTTDHAMVCPRGGLPSIKHNEIHDLLGEVLADFAPDAR